MTPTGIKTYREFWPFYLAEHSHPWTRRLHVVGTFTGFGIAVYRWQLIPLALVVAYGFAWASHFLIEKNKPATFRYPFWSFISDFRMIYCQLTGKIN